MDKDRLKLALMENLRIKLDVKPLEVPDMDRSGNVYGIRKLGNKVKAFLYWKEDGQILSTDEVEIKK